MAEKGTAILELETYNEETFRPPRQGFNKLDNRQIS